MICRNLVKFRNPGACYAIDLEKSTQQLQLNYAMTEGGKQRQGQAGDKGGMEKRKTADGDGHQQCGFKTDWCNTLFSSEVCSTCWGRQRTFLLF